MGLFNWASNKVKSHDLYAKPVTFMYDGESKIRSTYGGLVSLMIKLVVVIGACLLTRVIFRKSNTK